MNYIQFVSIQNKINTHRFFWILFGQDDITYLVLLTHLQYIKRSSLMHLIFRTCFSLFSLKPNSDVATWRNGTKTKSTILWHDNRLTRSTSRLFICIRQTLAATAMPAEILRLGKAHIVQRRIYKIICHMINMRRLEQRHIRMDAPERHRCHHPIEIEVSFPLEIYCSRFKFSYRWG